jgi:hypothetical protein
MKLLFDMIFFLCLQSNERTVKNAVGALNCRPRGFKLKDLIDSVAEEQYNRKTAKGTERTCYYRNDRNLITTISTLWDIPVDLTH